MPKIRTSPPLSSLPTSEQEICGRLRDIVDRLGIYHRVFAQRLRIPVPRLKSYLAARAPIRAYLAEKICVEFNVNERWFATGLFPATPAVYFPFSEVKYGEERQLFSELYRVELQAHIEPLMRNEDVSSKLYSTAEAKPLISNEPSKISTALSQVRMLLKVNASMGEKLNELSSYLGGCVMLSARETPKVVGKELGV